LRPLHGLSDCAGNDLWRTFSRAQENAIRGRLTAWGRDARNRPRRVTSREVTGTNGDVRLNRALWTLTERMAELKGPWLCGTTEPFGAAVH
jgi:hypothetical protein